MSLLFVYGTLRCEEVVETILGEGTFKNAFKKVFKEEAILPCTKAFYITGEEYPALTKSTSGNTTGLLYDVSDKELAKIIQYEDPEDYDLIELDVLNKIGSPLKAKVFWPRESLKASIDRSRPWSYESWKQQVDLELFLSKVRVWASS